MTPPAVDAHVPARWSTVEVSEQDEREVTAELAQTWHVPRGLLGWFRRADHRSIGRRTIVTAFLFFAAGGVLAFLMRLQLARADNTFIGPDLYNQIFTMHGSTMMFLFAVPMVLGFGIYLVPLMIGAREIAFPRMNAFGYSIYACGGLFLYVAFLLNIGPDTGWFTYQTLSSPQYSPGKRVDIWAQLINFTELSALVIATQLIVTIFKLRAPGMSLARMPLFVWSMLVTSFMVIFAMPAIMTCSLFLATDRLVGTQFYNPAEGGDVLLWQHLFWFFGHPEVYIIFLPALGIVSHLVSTFCQRPVLGYTAIVLSMVATGFVAFGLWVHHMFATPLPQMGEGFFTAASILIAIPSGVQIFCWIATIWNSRQLRLETPMLFVLAFIVTFVMGGLTGVMLGAVPLDLQVHDTFFVVAHLHYVLIGGSVFPLFGGLYFWFPKLTGRMLSERLGRWNVALMFIGFHLTFYPMHHLGLQGMPRRVYTYGADRGWEGLNQLATFGAVVLGLSVLTFVINVALSLRRGERPERNPWHASTLEWATLSPPPAYNFAYVPVVHGREPLWESDDEPLPIVTGLRTDTREVLVTTLVDAMPDHRTTFPEPSLWPLLTALTTTGMFVGALFTPWAIVYGGAAATVTLIGWFWPYPARPHGVRQPASVGQGRGQETPA